MQNQSGDNISVVKSSLCNEVAAKIKYFTEQILEPNSEAEFDALLKKIKGLKEVFDINKSIE